MIRGSRHSSSLPAAHRSQSRHTLPPITETRSSSRQTGTSVPTAAMTPEASCPSVSGGGAGSGTSPSRKWRSEAQMPHASTRTTTSAGPGTGTEGEARELARTRLDHALDRFRALGAEADGEVGDGRPLEAVRDALREGGYDEVILSTLPPGLSRWLKLDLPTRVAKAFGLPVTHVVADAEPGSRTA